MFNNVRSISSGSCENNEFENVDYQTCAAIATSRDATFRTVTNPKYAQGCVQVGDSVYYNDTPSFGGSASNDAVQQLCMLPSSSKPSAAVRSSDDSASDRMFDGTWLDKSIVNSQSDKPDGLGNSGYFPVNIRTVHQAVFYVNTR